MEGVSLEEEDQPPQAPGLLGSLHLDLPEHLRGRHHATGCNPMQAEWDGEAESSVPGWQAGFCYPCPDSGTSLIMTETKCPSICGPVPSQNYTHSDVKGGQNIVAVGLKC